MSLSFTSEATDLDLTTIPSRASVGIANFEPDVTPPIARVLQKPCFTSIPPVESRIEVTAMPFDHLNNATAIKTEAIRILHSAPSVIEEIELAEGPHQIRATHQTR